MSVGGACLIGVGAGCPMQNKKIARQNHRYRGEGLEKTHYSFFFLKKESLNQGIQYCTVPLFSQNFVFGLVRVTVYS